MSRVDNVNAQFLIPIYSALHPWGYSLYVSTQELVENKSIIFLKTSSETTRSDNSKQRRMFRMLHKDKHNFLEMQFKI